MHHTFEPVYNIHSNVLILGTFPSVKSREERFFYGNPQNRFWKVISAITNTPLPLTIEAKKAMLLEHRIAIWDVIHSCEITGSSDSSIKNVVPMDFTTLLQEASIKHIYANGATAEKLYQKYCEATTLRSIIKLPSTSPANAAWSLEKLIEAWRVIVD
ncbi:MULTISPECIES: DNA-deoxyinosine glycosylase [unclassified Sulfurospirillum]|uniref:DNA-deoxyinosine glycosylase n=1 Tax=unclassified Sulfurospirillum TaxID=2618290 RepID=UPI0005068030|nr:MULTISPECIES: DNA-deoxyinosine glycosylase [unclassified Sulfurospirillum]KFL33053.1 DNA glycosylase [Sulfurospirillum sp. SCADC]